VDGIDERLIDRSRRGDADAYRELMLRYEEIAFRTAFVVTRDTAAAEDAVQEGFIKAFYALPRFRSGAPFHPWLLRIVTNEARNQRRSAGQRDLLVQRAGRVELSEPAIPSPEHDVLLNEDRRRVHRELQLLPDGDRIILTMRYYLDLTPNEIATILDCPHRTVRSRLARALKRLEVRLSEAQAAEVGALERRGHDTGSEHSYGR
jgi:RNA polymerase sigma factor (sigma-70 family)